MKKNLFITFLLGMALSLGGCRSDAGNSPPSDKNTGQANATNSIEMAHTMKLTIKTHKGALHATLDDSAASRDFIKMLPITLKLEDYNRTEKIASLPERLSTADSPEGFMPRKGDMAFYAPWGNLCIFYRDFRYSPGLVLLGKIDGEAIAKLVEEDSPTVTIDIQR